MRKLGVILRLTATAKFIQEYKCCVCGKRAAGDTVLKTFSGESTDDLKVFLDAQELRAWDMPVGWGNYDAGFKCPDHVS